MSASTDLGVGVGLRPAHLREIFRDEPAVDFFEIISENYLVDGGPPLRNLDRIRERYPVVQHGVGMGIGSADAIDRDYLRRLRDLCSRTRTPWFSDHLCWTRSDGVQLHDLLPLPYTEEVIRFVAARADQVQDFVGVPFALENLSSYVGFAGSRMPEWEFFRAVVEEADCRMLLDVNNVYVSAKNHGFDPYDYLRAIPYERVVQVHVAGHTVREDGSRLDTHDHPVCDEVWELYRYVHDRTGGVSTLLEWDGNFRSFADTLAEARKADRFRAEPVRD